MEKPSLQDIAAMPYPASVQAMREHYNPAWGRGKDGELQKFDVEIEYSIRSSDTFICEVEAVDEDEARQIAEDKFDKECPDADEDSCDIDDIRVFPAE